MSKLTLPRPTSMLACAFALSAMACGAVADATDSSDDSLRKGETESSNDPLTLLVVFDTSGSMSSLWDTRSRWHASYDAVLGAVTTFKDNLTVGAVVFPSDGACGVSPIGAETQFDFQTGPAFIASWEQRMTAPNGSTPLYLGLVQADLAIQQAEARGLLENRFRVLIFSDGEPTCADDLNAIRNYPARWYEKGIETYVLALPGSTPAAQLLDDMADAGGTGAMFGGGSAIVVDETAQEIYMEGVEEEGASRVIVDEEDELDDITHAAAR